MKISLARVPRRPPWPAWAVAVVATWLALVGSAVYIAAGSGRHLELCLFKFVTHLPCPTCGSTRGVFHLLHGRLLAAWLCNPLVFSVGLLFLVVVIMRIFTGRVIRVTLSLRERRIAWILAAVLVIANWIYVIIRVG
jgi:hypothetical protein